MAVSFKGRRWPLLLSVAGFAALGAAGLAQGDAPEPAPQAVRAQVALGMELYQANCASCHGDNLDGGQFAQSLADGAFKAKWAGRNAQALLEYIRNSMPPGNARSLSDEAYAALQSMPEATAYAVPGLSFDDNYVTGQIGLKGQFGAVNAHVGGNFTALNDDGNAWGIRAGVGMRF